MKRVFYLTVLLFTAVVMLAACGKKLNSDYTQNTIVSGKPEAPGSHISVPMPTPVPTPTSTPIPVSLPEKSYLTLEQVNEINKTLLFKRSGEYHEIRAMLMNGTGADGVLQSMAGIIFGYKFLDKDNPYLTKEDTRELEWLKAQGFDFENVVKENRVYARIPMSELRRMLYKYTGASSSRTIKSPKYIYNSKDKVFYVKPTDAFMGYRCTGGYVSGNEACLYSDGIFYDKALKLEKKNDNWMIAGLETDYSRSEHNVYRENNTSVEEYLYRVKPVYLYEYTDRSEEFNAAIRAFDTKLKQIARTQDKGSGADRYAVHDITGDGIPELLVNLNTPMAYNFNIYTYVDGKLIKDDMFYHSGQHGPRKLMRNGMVGDEHVSTGSTYNFWKYYSDGTCRHTTFSSGLDTWYFNGKKVTKEEFNNLTEYYLKEFEKEEVHIFSNALPMYDYKVYP